MPVEHPCSNGMHEITMGLCHARIALCSNFLQDSSLFLPPFTSFSHVSLFALTVHLVFVRVKSGAVQMAAWPQQL